MEKVTDAFPSCRHKDILGLQLLDLGLINGLFECGVTLQGGHDLGSKQAHIQLPLLVGHATIGEIAHNMVGAGQVPQLRNKIRTKLA